MGWIACLLGLLATSADAGSSAKISRAIPRIVVEVEPGPYFVGQGIALDLVLSETQEEATETIEPPSISDGQLIAVESARGGRARFRLVPSRAGTVTIPPFRIRRDGRTVGSKRATIEVANVPLVGRPAAFLGGVGQFEVASSVEPATVRLGQLVDYQIKLTGPAAWGTRRAPAFPPVAGIEIRQVKLDRAATVPPMVTFRYQLRATGAGRIVLKPVAIAALNPGAGRYATRYCASQTLTVEPPPSFDPTQVDFGPLRPATMSKANQRIALGFGVILAGLLGLIRWYWRTIRRWFRNRGDNRPIRWHREAARLARAVRDQREIHLIAAEIAARFTRLLAQVKVQPVAVLTPPEAAAIVDAVTSERNLADRTGRLVARLDQIRFGPDFQTTAGDQRELVAEAVAVLNAIGEKSRHSRIRQVNEITNGL